MALARAVTMLKPAVATVAKVARPAAAAQFQAKRWCSTEGEFQGNLPEELLKREAEEHAAWLEGLANAPVYEPDFYWSLEFALPPQMELHQFTESPVIIEVQNRDPDFDPSEAH